MRKVWLSRTFPPITKKEVTKKKQCIILLPNDRAGWLKCLGGGSSEYTYKEVRI